jgi:fructan beta-fructosidase
VKCIYFMAAVCCGSLCSPAIAFAADRDDVLIADFEGDTYGDWMVKGEAFGRGPARGTLPGQMAVSGFMGKGLVNSFLKGDGSAGTLTSPMFAIERPYLNFLLGGGHHPDETCVHLLVDGKVVRTASGPQAGDGGSEQLEWHTWNVADLVGKQATIEIVDRHTGGWGHINVDQIVESDKRRQTEPAAREITIDAPFLNLPVRTGGAAD